MKNKKKDRVTAVHLDLVDTSPRKSHLGTYYFFREYGSNNDRISSSHSVNPHNLPRIMEAQRLFLLQIKKRLEAE